VPGGGPSADRTRWIGCRPGFFLPVKVLSRFYSRLFLTRLQVLRGKQDEKAYCLTGECSRDVKRCLTKRAPVASSILRPSRSSFSDL
jgi:hypothetical protein